MATIAEIMGLGLCYICKKWKRVDDNGRCGTCRNHIQRQKKILARNPHWLKMLELSNGCCISCGQPTEVYTVDHIIPLSIEWNWDIQNLQPLCSNCNNRKGERIIDFRPGWWFPVLEEVIDEDSDSPVTFNISGI